MHPQPNRRMRGEPLPCEACRVGRQASLSGGLLAARPVRASAGSTEGTGEPACSASELPGRSRLPPWIASSGQDHCTWALVWGSESPRERGAPPPGRTAWAWALAGPWEERKGPWHFERASRVMGIVVVSLAAAGPYRGRHGVCRVPTEKPGPSAFQRTKERPDRTNGCGVLGPRSRTELWLARTGSPPPRGPGRIRFRPWGLEPLLRVRSRGPRSQVDRGHTTWLNGRAT